MIAAARFAFTDESAAREFMRALDTWPNDCEWKETSREIYTKGMK